MGDDDIKVASTTDEMEDVEAAAEVTPEELAEGRVPEVSEVEEPDEELVEPRGKGGFQKRIDKLTEEKYANRRRIQELESRLREIEEGTRSEQEATPAEKTDERSGEEQPPVANEQTRQREAAERQAREVHTRFALDYEKALPKGSPDRIALEQAALRTQAEVGGIHTGVAQIVMSMPNSIDCYAHLCTHPDDLRVLNACRSEAEAIGQVRYLSGVLRGMGHAQQAQPASKPKRPVRPAAEPVRPNRGVGASEVSLDDPNLSYADYRRIRDAQSRGARRG